MARHIGGTLTLALLMVAGGGGFSISQKKRPLSGHSATLEHIGVDILWANAALAAHCQQYGQPVVTYENLAEDLHVCLAFEPVFNQPAEKPQKTPGEVGESKFVNQWPNALSKWLTTDINTFSRLLTQTHPGSTHAASILFLPRANRPWHSFFTRALHYLSGGGTKLKSSAG